MSTINISTNTSYNPQHHGGKMSSTTLIQDLLKSYKLGIKTLYYQNTHDAKGEEEEVGVDKEIQELLQLTEDCDSCSI